MCAGALAVINLLFLLVSFRKVLVTGFSGLACLLTIAASWMMHQVLVYSTPDVFAELLAQCTW